MAIYIVLRHPDAEQLWANSWVSGTCLVEAITTDAIVAGQCGDARRTEDYVYVHRCAHGDSPAMIVSKGKVREVQKLDRAFYLVSFDHQTQIGREPPRPAEQGDRSYIDRAVD